MYIYIRYDTRLKHTYFKKNFEVRDAGEQSEQDSRAKPEKAKQPRIV